MDNHEIITVFILGTLLFLILSGFILSLALLFQKRRQQHTKELTEIRHTYEQTLLRSQLEIQEETLRNISQEIHDNIGQVLSLAKLQLNTFAALQQEDVPEMIAESKSLVSKAIADLRGLSKSLHPDRVNELGLEENIRHELDMLQKTRLYETDLQIIGTNYDIPVQTQTILFRIVQEAISNIIKHAHADEVQIVLDYHPQLFCLSVKDNGMGLSNEAFTATTSGIGLKNMQNRSSIIGALFEVLPVASGGTEVKICLPQHQKT